MKNDKYKLTPRQKDVFNLILKGMNNIQIGKKLGITSGTTKLLSHQIMKKLGCHSKNEIMAKFL